MKILVVLLSFLFVGCAQVERASSDDTSRKQIERNKIKTYEKRKKRIIEHKLFRIVGITANENKDIVLLYQASYPAITKSRSNMSAELYDSYNQKHATRIQGIFIDGKTVYQSSGIPKHVLRKPDDHTGFIIVEKGDFFISEKGMFIPLLVEVNGEVLLVDLFAFQIKKKGKFSYQMKSWSYRRPKTFSLTHPAPPK